MTFVAAVKAYFGYNPNYMNLGRVQTTSEFMGEIKEISFKDKLEFAEMLRGTGLEVEDPKQPAA